MGAAKYDLVVEQGATLSRTLAWTDSAGDPIDLTGARIRFQFRDRFDDALPFLSYDSALLAAGQSVGALDATGVCTFTVSDELTADLDFDSCIWDLTVETAAGEVNRMLEGMVILRRSVTRPLRNSPTAGVALASARALLADAI